MAEPVVLINVFELPAGEADTFIAEWEKAADYLKMQAGYMDTTLHQTLNPDAEFQFVNVARWRTAEDFFAAIQSPGFQQAAAGLSGVRAHASLYRAVRR